MNAEVLVFGGLAAVAANLPFMTDRIAGFYSSANGRKPFYCRLLEWLLLYVVLGGIAYWLEGRTSPVHPQQWPFYVTTLCLFLVFAWPGFVWRYFWRKPGI
ncbi:DUF2818 family protein [Chitinilyticum piscinae]|uniref:DUF2818 family protein n=1 Tax=Chitinilyticum piscinae TaxID=2866724 RepID=A0A8J7K9Q0_9NEIS|nr:DUF2818 family protein [Chitinilyticum piscinae]MBE9608494.1 DUF2818 family protein [Chitinilyticum piscinae]